MKKKIECEDAPDGRHNFVPDIEYDITGQTINCEYCGEPESETKDHRSSEPQR